MAALSRLRALIGSAPPPGAPDLKLTAAMLSDVGSVRSNNEDSVAFVLPTDGRPALVIVADGMGGHDAGEVASGIATSNVLQRFFEIKGTIPHRLEAAFAAANAAIRAHGRAVPETAGMGTTCTALAFSDAGVFLGHIGDSRAYHVRDGRIRQISEDHSLVADLVRQGVLTQEEAASSPDRNVILRAMGIADSLQPQITSTPLVLQAGDVFVLCSDGLSDLVSPDIILAIAQTEAPDVACRRLVDAALAAGGHDNISVGVLRADVAGKEEPNATLRDTRQTELDAQPPS